MTICKTSGASVNGQGREEAIARFHRAITAVFGVSLRNDKTFAALCDAVESPIKSKAAYGGDESAIKLMRYLRKKMIEYGLAPKEPLKHGNDGEIPKFRTELLKSMKGFQERFPKTWEYDCKTRNPNFGYTDDGWDYQRVGISAESENEWLAKKGDILTHFYYNELDHYFTHFVGKLRGYTGPERETGLKIIIGEIEKEIEENE